MSWHSVLTESGASLLAAAIDTSFYLTKITLGSGTAADDLTKQVALLDEKATATSVKIYNSENASIVTYEYKNTNLDTEFALQQVGIWAKQNEADDDILYMILQDDSEIPTTIKSATDSPGYTYAATINIVVGGSSVLNTTTTEAGTVKYDEVFDENGMYIGSKLKNTVVSFSEAVELTEIKTDDNVATIFGKIKNAIKELIAHVANKSNPHNVTLGQLGGVAASHTHEPSDINGLENSFTALTNAVASNSTEIKNIKTNVTYIEKRVENLENPTVDELVDISSNFGSLQAEYLTDGVECNVSAYKKGNYVFGTIDISGALNSFDITFDINKMYAPTYDLTKLLPNYVIGEETHDDEPVFFNGYAVLSSNSISIHYTNTFYYTGIFITFEYYLSM